MTAGRVDYVTYQEAADRSPEIPADQFNRSLVLIQPDGTVLFAAEAVYRAEIALAVQEADPGTHETEPRCQPGTDGRRASSLPDGLARLLRLLRDTLGASRPGLVDSAATPLLPVETVETRDDPLRGTPQAGRGTRIGG